MIGIVALLLSLVAFLSVKLIDRRGGRAQDSYVRRIWSSLHESKRAYVVIHLALIFLIAISATVAIMEAKAQNQSGRDFLSFLIEGFSPFLWVAFWLLAAGYVWLFASTRFRDESEETAGVMSA